MTSRRTLLHAAGWTTLVLLSATLAYVRFRSSSNPVAETVTLADSAGGFRPEIMVQRFPPLTEFPIVEAAEAGNRVRDNEIVLGVEIGGEARAYPINVLTGPSREILNDTLGDRAIAATW